MTSSERICAREPWIAQSLTRRRVMLREALPTSPPVPRRRGMPWGWSRCRKWGGLSQPHKRTKPKPFEVRGHDRPVPIALMVARKRPGVAAEQHGEPPPRHRPRPASDAPADIVLQAPRPHGALAPTSDL